MDAPKLPPIPTPGANPGAVVYPKAGGGVRLEPIPARYRARVALLSLVSAMSAAGQSVLGASVAGVDRLLRWLRSGSERLLWTLGYARVDVEDERAAAPRVRVVTAIAGTTRREGASPGAGARGKGWLPRLAVGSAASSGPVPPPLQPAPDPRLATVDDTADADTMVFDADALMAQVARDDALDDANTAVAARGRLPTDDEVTRVTPANVLSFARYKARRTS